MSTKQRWTARIEKAGGKAFVPIPGDPSALWGERRRYDAAGTIGGHGWRGKVTAYGDRWGLPVGPVWLRDNGRSVGDEVEAVIGLEGPQIETLAGDVRAALLADPEAAANFAGMTTHCRKNYMRWVDEAKRPETRAARIAEMVRMVAAGEQR